MKYKVICCDCRIDAIIEFDPYPYGPNQVLFCPVCGQKTTKKMSTTNVKVFRILPRPEPVDDIIYEDEL